MSSAVSVRKQTIVEPRALVQAAEGGDLGAMNTLLAAGADVNAPGVYGKTALIAAAARGHAEIVRVLLERGANINAQKGDGFTALIGAVFFEQEEVVRVLLAHGADASLADETGATAYNWSLSRGLPQLAKVLKEAGGATTPAAAPNHPVAPREISEPAPEETSPLELEPEPETAPGTPWVFAIAEPTPASLTATEIVETVGTVPPVLPPPPPADNSSAIDVTPNKRKASTFPWPGSAGQFFQPALGRLKFGVTLRQLVIAFFVGGFAGGVLALLFLPQEPPAAAAPLPANPASNAGVADNGPAPPALPTATDRSAKKSESSRAPKKSESSGREAVAAPASTLKSTAGKKGGTERDSAHSAKPARATTEKRTEERTASRRAAAVKPESARPKPPPAGDRVRQASENSRPRPKAAVTARTEKSASPPPNGPQPTASPAKKVIRWP